MVKPVISSKLNSRCQVDLIHYQFQLDGVYKFVFVYHDHLTKFVILRPLTSKTAEEVSSQILDIFLIFGAICIFECDNGRELKNKRIVEMLKELWPELAIVHGKPRHSQSQGNVERANQDIENMLTTWMHDNKTIKWSEELKYVKFMKNRSLHAGINRTPYEAMFGCAPKVGLKFSNLLRDICHSLETEEDLENVLKSNKLTNAEVTNDEGNPSEISSGQVPVRACFKCTQPVQSSSKELCGLCSLQKSIEQERKEAHSNLEHQAKKMKLRSNNYRLEASVGKTVRVPVPDVDRAKSDARNILRIILEVNNEGFYRIGTRDGVIDHLFLCFQFTLLFTRYGKM